MSSSAPEAAKAPRRERARRVLGKGNGIHLRRVATHHAGEPASGPGDSSVWDAPPQAHATAGHDRAGPRDAADAAGDAAQPALAAGGGVRRWGSGEEGKQKGAERERDRFRGRGRGREKGARGREREKSFGQKLSRARSGPAGSMDMIGDGIPAFGRGLLRIVGGGGGGGDASGRGGAGRSSHENCEDVDTGHRIAPQLFTFTPFSGEDAAEHLGVGDGGFLPDGGLAGGAGAPGAAGAALNAQEKRSTFAQAGGHDGVFKAVGPQLEKVVNVREKMFYEHAFHEGAWPTQFLPRYHGDTGRGDGSIGLQNLVYGMDCPCVLDLKLGTQTVEDDEGSMFKKFKMNALDFVTRTKAAGVRLEGMSMYRVLEQARIKTSKSQSHVISASVGVTLQDVLTFFLTDESGVRTDVALRFQAHIEAILHHFVHNNDKFLFIGSSILLVYNNDNRSPYMRWARALSSTTRLGPDRLSSLTRRTKVDVRMIDFAHTGPLPHGVTRDEGYITGLHSILNALRAIRATRARPIFSIAAAADDALEHNARVQSSAAAGAGGSMSWATGSSTSVDAEGVEALEHPQRSVSEGNVPGKASAPTAGRRRSMFTFASLLHQSRLDAPSQEVEPGGYSLS